MSADDRLTIAPSALSDFAATFRASGGWLVSQCSTPVSSALVPARSAFDWSDDVLAMLGTRWDREVDAIAGMLRMFETKLLDAATAYKATDDSVSQGR